MQNRLVWHENGTSGRKGISGRGFQPASILSVSRHPLYTPFGGVLNGSSMPGSVCLHQHLSCMTEEQQGMGRQTWTCLIGGCEPNAHPCCVPFNVLFIFLAFFSSLQNSLCCLHYISLPSPVSHGGHHYCTAPFRWAWKAWTDNPLPAGRHVQ